MKLFFGFIQFEKYTDKQTDKEIDSHKERQIDSLGQAGEQEESNLKTKNKFTYSYFDFLKLQLKNLHETI